MPHLCIYKTLVNVVIDGINDTLAIKISSHYYFHVSLFTQSYQEYLVDGENYMRVKFYIKGSNRKGTVHVDVKQVILVFIYFSKIWFCTSDNHDTLYACSSSNNNDNNNKHNNNNNLLYS